MEYSTLRTVHDGFRGVVIARVIHSYPMGGEELEEEGG
jgi:hypothetical protein